MGSAQREHAQITPQPGWVEHDPEEIYARVGDCVQEALDSARLSRKEIAGVGITNQRETTVAWRRDGTPLHNAIVWLDARTQQVAKDIETEVGGVNALRP